LELIFNQARITTNLYPDYPVGTHHRNIICVSWNSRGPG
jgi:hypothetical protein